MSTKATSFQNLWFGCGFSICWSTNPVVSTCLVVGQTPSQRFVRFELARLHVDSCFVSSWESETEKTLNNTDVFENNMMLLNHIKPIEIWEQLHQLMSRDTILQQKSCFQVLQPDEAPLLMEYLTKLLEQPAFWDWSMTVQFLYVDESCEGCHDVLQAYCLEKIQRCYFALLKKWSGRGTWWICRTINWFGVFPLIRRLVNPKTAWSLETWDFFLLTCCFPARCVAFVKMTCFSLDIKNEVWKGPGWWFPGLQAGRLLVCNE